MCCFPMHGRGFAIFVARVEVSAILDEVRDLQRDASLTPAQIVDLLERWMR